MLLSDKPQSELSLGRTLTFAIKLYRRGFKSFFTSTLILSVLMFGLLTFVLLSTLNVVEGNPSYYYSAMGMIAQLFMASFYFLVLSLIYIIGAALLNGFNFKVADDIVNGRIPDYHLSLQTSLSGYIRTLLLFIILFIGISVGAWLLWIPAILAAILLPMSIPTHIIEGSDVLGSIQRGYRLIEGRWAKTFFLFLISSLFSGITFLIIWFSLATLAFIVIGIQGFVVTLIIVMITGAISYSLIEPFLYLTMLSHYYSMYARISPQQN